MAKLQLTITPDYCPSWGVYEGVREILQNGLDSQDDGHALTVQAPTEAKPVLVIANKGARLDRSNWLLGVTSKQDNKRRGMWGEGLKIGTLALVRLGRKVTIINDDETWMPSIEDSQEFGKPVLTISTRQRSKGTGEFRVEIELTPAEWSTYRSFFLAFSSPTNVIACEGIGKILLDPEHQGRVFIKGIHVKDQDDLSAGFDFEQAQTDRDRRMLDIFDIKHHCARLWIHALERGLVTAKDLLERMVNDALDTHSLRYSYMSSDTRALLGSAFLDCYGEKAMPVTSLQQARELEHFGIRGILVPEQAAECLAGDARLNLNSTLKTLRHSVSQVIQWSDMSSSEKDVYSSVIDLVSRAADTLDYAELASRLRIVEFNRPELLGTHIEGKIQVSRCALESFEKFVTVLVHELAHDRGSDGDVRHERAEGELFARILTLCGVAATPTAVPTPVLACA